jgi:two-component system, chemotaxis family, protein-glutamate methylesterase/glutaminase
VWHIPPFSFGVLPDVLDRETAFAVAHARDGEPVEHGRIYVAPPDRHLLLEDGHVRLTRGPKENHFRPAVDPLFRSAAAVYGPRVIGVVLSGALNDGTAGLWTIKDRGGLAVVQDPEDALYYSMPASAMEHVEIDARGPAAELGRVLEQLVRLPVQASGGMPMDQELEIENRIAMGENALQASTTTLGTPTLYTCPSCNGVLSQVHGGGPLRFRCHTGHAYTAETLVALASEAIEDTLWSAVRAMDENLLLLDQVAKQLEADGNHTATQRMLTQAQKIRQQFEALREVAMQQKATIAPPAKQSNEA